MSAIVTGGADGIGKAIALRFHEAGYRVHICDIRDTAVADMLSEYPGISGSTIDVGEAEEVARLFTEAAVAIGEVGVLVNNVGIGGPRALIENIVPDEWEAGTVRNFVCGEA